MLARGMTNTQSDFWGGTLLNLATELLGVVFVFFIVNYIFSLDDWELGDRIEALISKFEKQKTTLAKNFFHKKHSLEDYIEISNEIHLSGVTLTSTLNRNISLIRDKILSGSHVKILLMEDTSDALKMAALRSEVKDSNYFKRKLSTSHQDLEYLMGVCENSNPKGKLEIKTIPYPASFGIRIFDAEEKGKLAIIEIYSHHVDWGKPPVFTVDNSFDEEWFQFFKRQFDAMWKEGKDYVKK